MSARFGAAAKEESMRQRHPDWLLELFRTIDRRDAAGFTRHLTDDARFRYGSQPAVEGHEAIEAAVAAFLSGFRELRHELREVWEIPDRQTVFVQGEAAYTLPNGTRVELPFLNLFRLRGKLIVDYLVYADPTPLASPGSEA
jgi:ketosteroid isomerase-like protein